MRELMLGNKAVARGLYEGGCRVISSYPGTPSTEITEEAALYEDIYCEWAPNEKVALEAAHGASLGGARSACAMKHVGLNVAADPLFTISYQGVNAGLVICVADDPGMHSSQNEQDSRHYAQAAKVPMLEPADSGEALLFARRARLLFRKLSATLRACSTSTGAALIDIVNKATRKTIVHLLITCNFYSLNLACLSEVGLKALMAFQIYCHSITKRMERRFNFLRREL